MILAQLPWSADTGVQIMGRVNRTAQISKPIYRMVAGPTDARFAGVIARRLESLSAATQATGEGSCGTAALDLGLGAVIVSATGGGAALDMDEAIASGTVPAVFADDASFQGFTDWAQSVLTELRAVGFNPGNTNLEGTALVTRLLNRLMICTKQTIDRVNAMLNSFLQLAIFKLKKGGKYNVSKLRTITTSDRTVVSETINGSGGLKVLKIETELGISFEEAVEKQASLRESNGTKAHFYASKDAKGRLGKAPYVLLAHRQKGHFVRLIRPHGKIGLMLRDEFREKYTIQKELSINTDYEQDEIESAKADFAEIWNQELEENRTCGRTKREHVFVHLDGLFDNWNVVFGGYDNSPSLRTTRLVTEEGEESIGVSVSQYTLQSIQRRITDKMAAASSAAAAKAGPSSK